MMTVEEKILGYLRLMPMSVGQIAHHSKMPRQTIAGMLAEMQDEGRVAPVGFLPPASRGPAPMLWGLA